ncbi:hypothetical protein N0V90_005961 [Kalmusia sp. IMI 367209]|nr:hypothetical protein N0V90_005961 [Kalmusia sp. IMI 367209]
MARPLRRDDYTVGWVCALPVELAAAQEMLDEEHPELERDPNDNDENLYTLGSINGHNVVIVCLPAGRIGNNPAAAIATQMRATFRGIRFGLMVGIGGGVPSAEADVRLGDVVVSKPDKTFGGVVQYDFGKATLDGFERKGSLNSPPQILLSAIATVQAKELRDRSRTAEHFAKLDRIPKFQRSKTGPDVLFDAAYDHKGGQTCDNCSMDRQEIREARDGNEGIVVHYGTIASGNQVVKNALERDMLSRELGQVLCFEMEAAGLMNSFPCLVVRGICDYADSHKNKRWQPYAAGVAAAYAKELLSVIPATDVSKTRTADEAMQSASRRAIYSIPFLKNLAFVGREAELDVLKEKLMVDRTCRKLSIVGLGGTGKTQVALQLVYLVKKMWPEFSIFWMPALSMESFEQACVEIMGLLGTPQGVGKDEDAKELVKQYLGSARAGKWLVVVDNADDRSVVIGHGQSKGIVDYLPQSEEGVILFTTRTRDVAVSLSGANMLKLGPMEQQDAVNFLETSLTEGVPRDKATTIELLDELAYLPLAIVQATAYLNINEMSIARYLQLLRGTEHSLVSLLSKEFRDDTRYEGSANAIATTWVVSFSEIRARDAVAADLLLFISCIEWKAIPRSILPSEQSEVRMEDAIGTLCGYSFLTRRGYQDWYDMHRLVHLATQIWVRQLDDTVKTAKMAMRQVTKVFPLNPRYENQNVWRAYLPHALQLLGDSVDYDVTKKAQLCLLVGKCMYHDGRMKEAVAWLEESCRRRDALDEDDSDRLASQHELALAYGSDGQIQKAIGLLEHVVKVQEMLPAEHPNRLASQHVLAMAYISDGQIQKAIVLLEHVVKVREMLPAEHPDRLVSQHVLAIAYKSDGQIQKAIGLSEHVVKVQEMLLAEHPNRLASQHVLASAYQSDGQIQKAIGLLEHVVKVEEMLLAEHPNRLASQHVLASAYQSDGQVKKAVELLEHVVAVRAQVLRHDHPDRLASQYWLAVAYHTDGQVKKAVKLLEHVVAVQGQVLRHDHPNHLVSQHWLAVAYHTDGQVKKAVKLLEHVVAVQDQVLRHDHPNRLSALAYLAGYRAELADMSNETSSTASPESFDITVLSDSKHKRRRIQ